MARSRASSVDPIPEDLPSTRERLIEAARDLFVTQGYSSTGIAQILKTAGARSGSLYHFFPTKEDLLLAVLDWYRQNIGPALLDPIWQRISDPIERVFGLFDGYRQMLLFTEFRHGCPIGNLALEVCETHPNARALINLNFDLWLEAVGSCFEEAAGRLPDGSDPKELAVFVLTTMEGAVMLARSYRSLDPFDVAITQLRDYVERLLADGSTWTSPRTRSTTDVAADDRRGQPTRVNARDRKAESHS
jgi:AcrR family transcriptional regulator